MELALLLPLQLHFPPPPPSPSPLHHRRRPCHFWPKGSVGQSQASESVPLRRLTCATCQRRQACHPHRGCRHCELAACCSCRPDTEATVGPEGTTLAGPLPESPARLRRLQASPAWPDHDAAFAAASQLIWRANQADQINDNYNNCLHIGCHSRLLGRPGEALNGAAYTLVGRLTQ